MVQTASRPHPAWLRAVAVLVAAAALGWAALVNGQPFFHPDTIGYVRGPDVAVMKLAGPRFATSWARFDPGSVDQRNAAAAAPAARVASYNDNEVLAGRSIYYGVLAYLGALAGGFWLTVFVQGLAVAWLAEIILRGLGVVGLRAYAAVIAVLVLATSAPFFAAFLMPDIWAGVAIGAVAALFALGGRLKALDVAALGAMTVFAALGHSSVAPVLLALMVAGGGWRLLRRGAPDPRPGLVVCVLALAAAVAGNFAFSKMVERTAGRPPLMPPFLSARVIADGPGTRFARERCAGAFAVCRYADRFPMDVDDFLWAPGQAGVFESASGAERRALGDEQARFALAAARAYPLQQAAASVRNAALQSLDTELSDFDYKPSLRASLTSRTPPAAAQAIRASLAYAEGWPLGPLWALQSAVVLASLAAAAWLAGRTRPGAPAASPEASRAVLLFALVVVGVLANGVVCGVLSTLHGRYEARVIWTVPLAACALALVSRRPAAVQRA
jgi:hypothetical protein